MMTGGNRGWGRILAQALQSLHHQVTCRHLSTGYDIRDLESRIRIASESLEYDAFLNFAYADLAQSELLLAIWEEWRRRGKRGRIVNFSSRASIYAVGEEPNTARLYDHAKLALDTLSDRLAAQSDILVSRVNFGHIDANSKLHKMNYEDATRIVIWLLEQPTHLHISAIHAQGV